MATKIPGESKLIISLFLFIGIAIGCTRVAERGSSSTVESAIQATSSTFRTSSKEASDDLKPNEDFTRIESFLKNSFFIEKLNSWKGKILLVKVDENSRGSKFKYYHYNSVYEDSNSNGIQDDADKGFFNPASTVKVGIVALVLEKLNVLKLPKESKYRVVGSSQWYSFDEDIKKVLLLSDNEATNRIILFLGFDNINSSLKAKGLNYFEVNRLMLNQGTLVSSPAFELLFERKILRTPAQIAQNKHSCFETKKTVGNCATATELSKVLIRLINPEAYPSKKRFLMREKDRLWVQEVMSKKPRDAGFNEENTFCRFLHPLSEKVAKKTGKLLSKCGIGLFSHTFIDTSFLLLDKGQKYYIVFSVNPPQNITKDQSIELMNNVVEFLLNKFNNEE